mgnify:CR=1 FL=1
MEKEIYEIRICRSREEYFEIEASSQEEAEEIANENAEALFDKDENNNSYEFIYDYCVNG